MEKVEIKYDKKKLWIGFVTLILIAIGLLYMAFFTELFATQLVFKILVTVISIFMIYGAYSQVKAVFGNYSVITLTKTHIEINEDGKPQTYLWMEIKELSIEKKRVGKGNIDILKLKLDSITKDVTISALDKSVDDIRELIKNYKPRNSTITSKMDNEF